MSVFDVVDKLFPENKQTIQDVPYRLSSGYPPLDYVLSGSYTDGGFPVGRISMVYGGSSTGKTLLATMACISNQKRGGLCIWLDFEHSFALSYAKQLGLSDEKSLWRYMSPDTAEEGFDKIKKLTDSLLEDDMQDSNILIVIDSLASMVTLEEDSLKNVEDSNMRTQLALASFMSKNMKWLAKNINKTNVTLLILNQTRSNPNPFTENETVPGGNAPKFYASTIVKLVKKGKVKEGDEILGEFVEAETVKNKTFRPFLKCSWITDFKIGIDIDTSVIEFMIEKNLIEYKGGWVDLGGKKMRKKEIIQLMKDDENFKKEMYGRFSQLEEGSK